MIKTRVILRTGEPRCSCGKYSMRFCVTQWAYCGRQSVSASRRWREKLGIAERPAQKDDVQSPFPTGEKHG